MAVNLAVAVAVANPQDISASCGHKKEDKEARTGKCYIQWKMAILSGNLQSSRIPDTPMINSERQSHENG